MNQKRFDEKRKKLGIRYKYYKLFDMWDGFWWIHHGNGIVGPGYSSYRTFKSGNLAVAHCTLGGYTTKDTCEAAGGQWIPGSSGIGSDAFAILWDGESLHGLNASGRSPAALHPERFGGLKGMPEKGWDTVTIPGAVSAWVELSSRFGKLPFSQLKI